MSTTNDARRAWQGGKWITPVRRLAIYLRDGMACAYCGASVEEYGVRLSLDHLKCNINGGGNESTNLVTACTRCNSARGARSVAAFCRAIAAYLGRPATDAKVIERHVRACARRVVPANEARELIVRRKAEVA